MKSREEVSAMLELHRRGWSPERIAGHLQCSAHTVARYLVLGGWRPRAGRGPRLAGLETWLKERLKANSGNADVVRQQLAGEKGIVVGLRTVQRAVRGFRRELRAGERATVRFETAPGYQMQIDFGVRRVPVGDAPVAVHLFVATLGYSRRQYARAFADESQRSWFEGMEEAFRHFGGVPATVLMDNAGALVSRPRRGSSAAEFHPRLVAFAAHWNFEPRACLPGRARTKGKDERSVGYVKNNAIGGREFASWGALEGHLSAWLREVADRRTHGTTGESPIARFATERTALAPLADRRSFGSPVELARTVSADCAVVLDTNQYPVPWRLVGERVLVGVADGRVRVHHGGERVADHARCAGRNQRIVDPGHFKGMSRRAERAAEPAESDIRRPLAEYEAVAGGGF